MTLRRIILDALGKLNEQTHRALYSKLKAGDLVMFHFDDPVYAVVLTLEEYENATKSKDAYNYNPHQKPINTNTEVPLWTMNGAHLAFPLLDRELMRKVNPREELEKIQQRIETLRTSEQLRYQKRELEGLTRQVNFISQLAYRK